MKVAKKQLAQIIKDELLKEDFEAFKISVT